MQLNRLEPELALTFGSSKVYFDGSNPVFPTKQGFKFVNERYRIILFSALIVYLRVLRL